MPQKLKIDKAPKFEEIKKGEYNAVGGIGSKVRYYKIRR